MKYWQKIFFSVLCLFVLVCNVCIFFVVKSMLAEEQQRLQQLYLRKAADFSYKTGEELEALRMRENLDSSTLTSLMQRHASTAKQQNTWIMLTFEGKQYGSNFPFAQTIEPAFDKGKTISFWWHEKEDSWYLNVCSSPAPDARLWQLFAVQELALQERKLICTGTLFAAVSPLVLAGLLYLFLRVVNRPIERLSEAARQIAAGDYALRVPVKTTGILRRNAHNRVQSVKAGDEMQQLAEDFNTMAAAVQEKITALEEENQRKQEFIDNMAHEMRTPLTMISGFGQLLSRAALEEADRQEALEKIITGASRLTALQESLLSLSLLKKKLTETQPVSLKELLVKVREGQQLYAQERGVEVQILGQDRVVQGDETLLYSLFDNLLHNALRAAEKQNLPVTMEICGDITQTLPMEKRPDINTETVTQVIVTDYGVGMLPEQLARIGEPFYRADKARSRKEGGAGLGVALCFEIAKAHGAALRFESQPGKGTRATVSFYNLVTF